MEKLELEKKWGKFLNFQRRNDKIKNAIVNSVKIYIYLYIDFNCPEYDRLGASIGGWRNIEVAAIPSYVNRLFRCRSVRNKHIAHWSEKIDGQKYAAFFAKDGISI